MASLIPCRWSVWVSPRKVRGEEDALSNLYPQEWAETPITEGRVVWDDAGYDKVTVLENGDPMVAVDGIIATHPVMGIGGAPKVSPFWEGGVGGPRLTLVREPVLWRLLEVNNLLKGLGLEPLVVEAYRPPAVQRAGFRGVFWRRFPGVPPEKRAEFLAQMSQFNLLEFGYQADKGFLAAGIDTGSNEFDRLAENVTFVLDEDPGLGDDLPNARWLYYKYRANLDGSVPLDLKANKPHGTGGSVDVCLRRRSTGEPVFMGSPSDDTGSVVRVLDYFEWATLIQYEALLNADSQARQYYADFCADIASREQAFEEARRNRRILFWAMQAVGASGYNEGDRKNGEWWHWNFGRHGGAFPGAGNGCHSLLMGVKVPASGEPVAVWGAGHAHRQAAFMLGSSVVYGS